MSETLTDRLGSLVAAASSHLDLWVNFINQTKVKNFAEIGVWRGEFAETILKNCPSIERYYLIDPWRHLDDWNKPANISDPEFDQIFEEAMARTEFAREKRIVVRATTKQAQSEIGDAALDAAYIDGDHTLKGITIDLVSIYDKVRPGGFIIGDDFTPSIWQHGEAFEPSMVFPLAVYFAEAKGDAVYGLPYFQFLIAKTTAADVFQFHDFSGRYQNTSLREQFLVDKNHQPDNKT
jgi:hypothetical protein